MDRLESRNLLSSIGGVASSAHTPVSSPAHVLQVAATQVSNPTGQQALHVLASASTTHIYFFALEVPWSEKKKMFQGDVPENVTVSIPVHISLVRNVSIAEGNLRSVEKQVSEVVDQFEHPTRGSKSTITIAKAFKFTPKTGEVVPLGDGFYGYKLSQTKYSKKNFSALGKLLCKLVEGSERQYSNKAHMSVFNAATILKNGKAGKEIVNQIINNDYAENLNGGFHPKDLALIKSLGSHKYEVVERWS